MQSSKGAGFTLIALGAAIGATVGVFEALVALRNSDGTPTNFFPVGLLELIIFVSGITFFIAGNSINKKAKDAQSEIINSIRNQKSSDY